MTKGGGVGPRALLSAGGRVYGGCLHGFSDLIAAIAALGVASAVPAIGLLLPIILFLVFEIIIALAVGVAVGELLAVGPHLRAVDGDIGAAGVVLFRLAAKAKELRAGGVVALCRNLIGAGNVEDVLVVPHVRIVDIKRLLIETQERLRVERAVVHVNGNVMLARAVIGEDIDDFATGIKGAAVKRHGRRAIGPESVIAARSVERRVPEHSGLIAPVERFAVDYTAVNNGVVGTNEAKIVRGAGTQRHVLERHGTGAVKGIVAVVLGAKIIGVGNLRTDVPCGLVRAQTLKGKVLALGVVHGAHAVEGVVALAEQDGFTALCLGGGGGKVGVGFTGVFIGNRAGGRAGNRAGNVVCESRRCYTHRDERNGKQRCDHTRGRFQKRLHAETPSTLIVFKSALLL